jgi:hypothetical protein
MKKLAALLTVMVVAAFVAAAHSQSLADLADKEKERRQDVQNGSKVITNAEMTKYRGGAVTTFGASGNPARKEKSGQAKPGQAESQQEGSEPEEGEAEASASADEPDPDEPVDFQGRSESFWRKTMADARQKVKALENESSVIILKLNDLQNRFYSEDDGFKRELIQKEIQKALYEQDRNKEDLAKAKDALQDLEKEARKSGALPGWIN